MHSLAILLQKMGHEVSGSDDEIYEPSRSKLKFHGLLPENMGWNSANITSEIDLILLGMHARKDNEELIKAQELGIRVESYPEFIAAYSNSKKRIVVAGSHGKTTTTAMIMHVLKYRNFDFDYLVGAELDGFQQMVKLSQAPLIIIEGDEYLSSCIDRRPKMAHYQGDINVITGISWDHVNVFKTEQEYNQLFEDFIVRLEKNAKVFIYGNDENCNTLYLQQKEKHIYKYYPIPILKNGNLIHDNKQYRVKVFGEHNRANISAALQVCLELGITAPDFFAAIATFKGASKRLELIFSNDTSKVYRDFAHAPSKVKATVKALKETFAQSKIIAFLELHTYSSLSKEFLSHYKNTMEFADEAYIYYSPHTLEMKKMEPLDSSFVSQSFGGENITVIHEKEELLKKLQQIELENCILIMMSSGNFDGLDLKGLFEN